MKQDINTDPAKRLAFLKQQNVPNAEFAVHVEVDTSLPKKPRLRVKFRQPRAGETERFNEWTSHYPLGALAPITTTEAIPAHPDAARFAGR